MYGVAKLSLKYRIDNGGGINVLRWLLLTGNNTS
jgi:hypothetical protein